MLFFTMQDVTGEKPYNTNKMHTLRNLLGDQLDDVTMLCTIAEYVSGFQQVGIDAADARKYRSKLTAIEERQQKRFYQIDEYISENILAIKKNDTADRTIMNYGKEVRKLEAGLRTLKLFVLDMIKMLEPNSQLENRTHERLYYFNKRSAVLEVEIKTLQSNGIR